MARRPRRTITEGQMSLLWECWQKGESLSQIARLLDRGHSSIRRVLVQSGGIRPAPRESSLGEALMDAEVANCSASKHGPGQSVKFLAAREHIDNQLYALDLCF